MKRVRSLLIACIIVCGLLVGACVGCASTEKEFSLTETSLEMKIGESKEIPVKLSDEEDKDLVEYTITLGKDVISLEGSSVKAVAEGNAQVMVTYNDEFAFLEVVVKSDRDEVQDSLDAINAEITAMKAEIEDLKGKYEDLDNLTDQELAEIREEIDAATADYTAQIKKLNDDLAALKETVDENDKVLQLAIEGLQNDLSAQIEDINDLLQTFFNDSEEVAKLAAEFRQGLYDVIINGGYGFEQEEYIELALIYDSYYGRILRAKDAATAQEIVAEAEKTVEAKIDEFYNNKIERFTESIELSMTSWYRSDVEGYETPWWLDTSFSFDNSEFNGASFKKFKSITIELFDENGLVGNAVSEGARLNALMDECAPYWGEEDIVWLSCAFTNITAEEGIASECWQRSAFATTAYDEVQPTRMAVTIVLDDENSTEIKVEEDGFVVGSQFEKAEEFRKSMVPSLTSWYRDANNSENLYLDTSITFDNSQYSYTTFTSITFELLDAENNVMATAVSAGDNLKALLADCEQYWPNKDAVLALSCAFKHLDEKEDNGYWERSAFAGGAYAEKQPAGLTVTIAAEDGAKFTVTKTGFDQPNEYVELQKEFANSIGLSVSNFYRETGDPASVLLDTSFTFDNGLLAHGNKYSYDMFESIKLSLLDKDENVLATATANVAELINDCKNYWKPEYGYPLNGMLPISCAFNAESSDLWVREQEKKLDPYAVNQYGLRVELTFIDGMAVTVEENGFTPDLFANNAKVFENSLELSLTGWYGDPELLDSSLIFANNTATISYDLFKSIKFEMLDNLTSAKVLGSALSEGKNLQNLLGDCKDYWPEPNSVLQLSCAFKTLAEKEDNGFWVRSPFAVTAYDEVQPQAMRVTITLVDGKEYVVEQEFDQPAANLVVVCSNVQEFKDALANDGVKVIKLLAGEYDMGYVLINRPVVIYGEGNDTVIKVNALEPTSGQAGFAVQSSNVSLSDFKVVSSNAAISTLKVTGVDHYVQNVELKNILVDGGKGLNVHLAEDVTLDNIDAVNSAGAALSLAGTKNFVVKNSKISAGLWGSVGIMFRSNSASFPVNAEVDFVNCDFMGIVYAEEYALSQPVIGGLEGWTVEMHDTQAWFIPVMSGSITGWYNDNTLLDTSFTFDAVLMNYRGFTKITVELFDRAGNKLGDAVSEGENLTTLLNDCQSYWPVDGAKTLSLSCAFKTLAEEEDNGFWVRSAFAVTADSEVQPSIFTVTIETSEAGTFTRTFIR